MAAVLLAALLLGGGASDEVGARIRASHDAAQGLQGPLDGAWTLRDAAGRPLYAFQFADPVGGGPLQGAWRDLHSPTPHQGIGVFGALRRQGAILEIDLPPHEADPAVTLRLRGDGRGLWLGCMSGDPTALAVVMRQD